MSLRIWWPRFVSDAKDWFARSAELWFRWTSFKFGVFVGVIVGMVIEAFWMVTVLTGKGLL